MSHLPRPRRARSGWCSCCCVPSSPGATTAGPASGALTYSRLPGERRRSGRLAPPPAVLPPARRLRPAGRRPRPPAARLRLGGEPDRGDRHRDRPRRLRQHGGRGLPAPEPPGGGEGGGRGLRRRPARRPDRPGGLLRRGPHQGAADHRPPDAPLPGRLGRAGHLPRGTAIGVALATAAARLRDSEAKSRVIVLVTDGVIERRRDRPALGGGAVRRDGDPGLHHRCRHRRPGAHPDRRSRTRRTGQTRAPGAAGHARGRGAARRDRRAHRRPVLPGHRPAGPGRRSSTRSTGWRRPSSRSSASCATGRRSSPWPGAPWRSSCCRWPRPRLGVTAEP